MRDTTKYGGKYWCIKVTPDLAQDGEIYLMADTVVTQADGSIYFFRDEKDTRPENLNLVIPRGKWLAVFAASLLDGSAVAVEHWKEEINEDVYMDDDGDSIAISEILSKKNNKPTRKAERRYPERDRMTQSLRYSILERDEFACKKCGRGNEDGVKLEVDHIVPVSKGGKTEPGNLETLCKDCNRGKSNKTEGAQSCEPG